MKRSGIGLKPLIAVYVVIVVGVLATALSYAALRLARHGLMMEQIRMRHGFLSQLEGTVIDACPQLKDRLECTGLEDLVEEMSAHWPGLRSLSVFDSRGSLVASSDPALEAESLWGAFGARTAGGGPNDDWSVWETDAGRVLVVASALRDTGHDLSASFSLAGTDRVAGRIARGLMLYTVLLAAVMSLVGWVLLYRLVVRPLDRLLQSADRISEGDLAFLLNPERGSELGRLGISLSSMAQRIEKDQGRLKDQISELKRLNTELVKAQQSLIRSEKLASVGKLAAGVAHEVGNPISAILGYVGMLRTEEIPDAERGDILARVEKEIERIDTVISDLLAYSRPGSKDVVAVSPQELAEGAMALIRPQKKYKQIDFEVQVPQDLPAVRTDPDLARQVLVNLMLNALDAVDPGGHIWLRAVVMGLDEKGALIWDESGEGPAGEREPAFFEQGEIHRIKPPGDGKGIGNGNQVVVFSVVDDGQGIAEAEQVHVFDPFYTTKDPGRGTGLGLAICHSAVTAMAGEIWIFSRRGRGCQLAFYLPREE